MSATAQMPNRAFSFSVFLSRAPDVAGQWVGHCLDVDVISQGDSLKQAFEMTREAVEMVVLDDLNHGREPMQRSAPTEEWEAAHAAVKSSGLKPRLYTMSELFEREAEFRVVMAPLLLSFVRVPANRRPAEMQIQEMGAYPLVQAA